MVTRGLFISFEGGDGAGKSTQAARLTTNLAAQGRQVLRTFEPGDTELGRQLRQLVQHGEDMSARTEALLYAADRAHHVHTVVRPALEKGVDVITDRYLDSSVAYQGVGRGLGVTQVEELSLWAAEGLLPDLTVLLDLDPQIGLGRITGNPDRLERAGSAFHLLVREAFRTRAQTYPDRFLMLDATAPVEELAATIWARASTLLR